MSWTGGDWMCGACQHVNFKKRDNCQKCGFAKFGNPDDVSSYLANKTEVLAGDWYCQTMNCGAHNYASRALCFRCGSMKLSDHYSAGYGNNLMSAAGFGMGTETIVPGWKSGDWICVRPGCGVHNYASRTECFRCKTPREFGEKLGSTSSYGGGL